MHILFNCYNTVGDIYRKSLHYSKRYFSLL